MSEPSAGEDASVTFSIKTAGGQKYSLTLPKSTTAIDLKNKLSTEEYANVPASAQRLIYSGKVLKDNDTLASINIKEGNSMHLVRSAASNQRQNPATQQSPPDSTTNPSSGATGVPQNLASGTGNDPLAGLTGARYAGFTNLPSASLFENLQNPPTQEDMLRQLEDPNFAQMMREAMNNPQIVDMMINSHPQLRAMGPQARQLVQSDEFRRMLTDPETIRSMMRMQQMFGGGLGGGAPGGQGSFPAPGVTNTTETAQNQQDSTSPPNQQGQQQNPFAAFGGGMGANPFAAMLGQPPANNAAGGNTGDRQSGTPSAANPFAALFNMPSPGAQQNAGDTTTDTDANANATSQPQNQMGNPFAAAAAMLQNPEAMQNMQRFMQNIGGGGGGGGGGAGAGGAFAPNQDFWNMLGGFGGAPDNRPPAERYATQLRQLNEMGFHDFDRNIQALSRSGGDVNGALEYLFSQPS